MNTLHWLLSLLLVLLCACAAEAAELAPPQDGYRLGPNDVIRIQVFGEDDLTVESKVEGDGKFNYPILGVLQVGGWTIEELQKELTVRLASGYLRLPKVSVSIVRHRNFYVSGEVKTPGGYPYEEGMSVQKAIAMAGGLTEKAEKGVLKATRAINGREETLPVKLETPVLPDDVLVVAEAQKLYVTGEVRTPGRYFYEPEMTVQRALTLAGGVTEKGEAGSIKITRLQEQGVQTSLVSHEAMVLPDDMIQVESKTHKFYVSGEVKTPGGYPYKEGLNLHKAIAMAGGLTEKGDRDLMKVMRMVNGREESIAVTLDTPVLPEDTLVIPERQKFYVTGEVKAPGRYFYEPGVTIQKAVTLAGGFTEKSDKTGTKVTRLNGKGVNTLLLEAEAPVMPDDLIVVARLQKFYVNGEVRNPGDYPYEKGLTVHKAITMAGGFTDKAATKWAKVLRIINGEERALEIALDALVLPEDIIVVSRRFF